jgi:hypothetical protein
MLSFETVWRVSKEIQKMNFGLVDKYPKGTECCLSCMVPKEERTLESECGICFKEGRCGCKWCQYCISYTEKHRRCQISLKLDTLRRPDGLGWIFDTSECSDNKGIYVTLSFFRKFPSPFFQRMIEVFKRYDIQYDSESVAWGKEFPNEESAISLFKQIYELVKEI